MIALGRAIFVQIYAVIANGLCAAASLACYLIGRERGEDDVDG